MVPFQLRYSLSRRQRLASELLPWVPAVTGSLGFGIGVAVLAVDVSRGFLLLLVIPALIYRGLFALVLDLVVHPGQVVEVVVDETQLEMRAGRQRLILPLEGIIQVFRSGRSWTVLHFNGSALSIPAAAIQEAQVDYLKAFARTALAQRNAGPTEY